jgi:hypothetical protein
MTFYKISSVVIDISAYDHIISTGAKKIINIFSIKKKTLQV